MLIFCSMSKCPNNKKVWHKLVHEQKQQNANLLYGNFITNNWLIRKFGHGKIMFLQCQNIVQNPGTSYFGHVFNIARKIGCTENLCWEKMFLLCQIIVPNYRTINVEQFLPMARQYFCSAKFVSSAIFFWPGIAIDWFFF